MLWEGGAPRGPPALKRIQSSHARGPAEVMLLLLFPGRHLEHRDHGSKLSGFYAGSLGMALSLLFCRPASGVLAELGHIRK